MGGQGGVGRVIIQVRSWWVASAKLRTLPVLVKIVNFAVTSSVCVWNHLRKPAFIKLIDRCRRKQRIESLILEKLHYGRQTTLLGLSGEHLII